MTPLVGCTIEPLDAEASSAWLDWVLGQGTAPRALTGPAWLLAHCDSGVTWGRLEDAAWRLSSDPFPDLCPRPVEEDLQELRIFSRKEEILLWRSAEGQRGRILRDDPASPSDDSTRPFDEDGLLLAGRVAEQSDGFTRVGDGTGAEQALPLAAVGDRPSTWPRLRVRHYFAVDSDTGAVRVAVSRLVELK